MARTEERCVWGGGCGWHGDWGRGLDLKKKKRERKVTQMQMGLKTSVSKANYFAGSLSTLHWPSFHKSQQELSWAEVHAGQ